MGLAKKSHKKPGVWITARIFSQRAWRANSRSTGISTLTLRIDVADRTTFLP
jgi:hypothetical protein